MLKHNHNELITILVKNNSISLFLKKEKEKSKLYFSVKFFACAFYQLLFSFLFIDLKLGL